MKSIVEIFELLDSDNSRLFKEQVLDDNARNELLKRVLVAALDPHVVYNVVKFKMPKLPKTEFVFACEGSDSIVEKFLVLLARLSSRTVTGNAARTEVENLFQLMGPLEQKWCQRILVKNLRCGVQASTVNKTWPGLIKEFEVALAETLKVKIGESNLPEDIKIIDKIDYPVYVDAKLDGYRCIVIKRFGEVSFFSRNGKPVDTYPTLKKILESANIDNIVLDCEACAADGTWETTSSLTSSKKNKKDDSTMVLHVFDGMPFDAWAIRDSGKEYNQRLSFVDSVVALVNHENVIAVNGKLVHNEQELLSFYRESLDVGHEGIMIKKNVKYVWDRSDAIMKLKPTTTHEGVIVGWYEGRDNTKRAGEFGGFLVVFPNGVVTKVGGGFKDPERVTFMLEGPDTYYGRIVECKGQFMTPDGKVRFPVFVRWRDASDVDPLVVKAGINWGNESISG